MSREVYISETNCITPIGFDVATNVKNIIKGISGISKQNNNDTNTSFFAASISAVAIDQAFSLLGNVDNYTKIEKLMILALHPIVKHHRTIKSVLVISTTKGNITALETNNIANAPLSILAKKVGDFFNFQTEPIVVSNACVSGILAVAVAKRLIQSEIYDEAYIVSGDLVSEFVLSGFNSFQAMSDVPCKPYSINRTGVTLGEAAAAVLVTSDSKNANVKIIGEGSINDANHISGPSRTGEGLVRSIQSALDEAKIGVEKIDYISAHGTATPFNDEMEAIAFNRLGFENVPVNSLKGYYGHTLGASGLLETVIGIASMSNSMLFASLGFDEIGVSQPINVIKKNTPKNIDFWLKTASGFGGCNTAVIFEKA